MTKLITIMFLLTCTSCATHKDTAKQDKENLNNAVVAPLKDLNLVKDKIPAVLLDIQKNPYLLPASDISCEQLNEEIAALDLVLAPDIDAIKSEKENQLDRGAKAISKASLSAIQRTTESLVPYRSWVRKLTGAERTSIIVAKAIKAGNLRRAFLKGYKAKSCSVGK